MELLRQLDQSYSPSITILKQLPTAAEMVETSCIRRPKTNISLIAYVTKVGISTVRKWTMSSREDSSVLGMTQSLGCAWKAVKKRNMSRRWYSAMRKQKFSRCRGPPRVVHVQHLGLQHLDGLLGLRRHPGHWVVSIRDHLGLVQDPVAHEVEEVLLAHPSVPIVDDVAAVHDLAKDVLQVIPGDLDRRGALEVVVQQGGGVAEIALVSRSSSPSMLKRAKDRLRLARMPVGGSLVSSIPLLRSSSRAMKRLLWAAEVRIMRMFRSYPLT